MMVDGLPQRQVTDVAFDPFHPDSITVTLNGYKDAVYTPHVFRAAIGGAWQDATGDLPDHPANDWRALNDSTWVIATDFGVYHTESWGAHWERVGDMPFIPVFELDVDTAGGALVAATFARSIQTFPLDSLVPEPAVEEPVDTTDVGVAGWDDGEPCLALLNHPFREGQGAALVSASWRGATWEVWGVSGTKMTEGVVRSDRVSWSTSGWAAGTYAVRLVRPSGEVCATTSVVAQ